MGFSMNWFVDTGKVLKRMLDDLSPSCRRVTRLQSEGLDRQLPILQRVGLRLHLVLCSWCRRYRAQIQFLRAAVRCSDQVAPPLPGLSPEARERIRRRLQDAQQIPDDSCPGTHPEDRRT